MSSQTKTTTKPLVPLCGVGYMDLILPPRSLMKSTLKDLWLNHYLPCLTPFGEMPLEICFER